MKKTFFFFFLFFLSGYAYTQPTVWKNFYSKNYSSPIADDGNYIYSIQGNQLVKFDKSNSYYQYSEIPDSIFNCSSLHQAIQDHINSLKIDVAGNLWLTTYKTNDSGYVSTGMYKFNGALWISYNALLSSNGITGAINPIFDNSGNLWFTNSELGLVKFDGAVFTNWDTLNSSIPAIGNIYSLAFDNANNIWMIINQKGVVSFDGINSFVQYDTSEIGYYDYNYNSMGGLFHNQYTDEIYLTSYYDTGYYKFSSGNWQHTYFDTTLFSGLSSYYYFGPSVLFKINGEIDYVFNFGILVQQGATYTLYQSPLNSYGSSSISFPEIDQSNNLWCLCNETISSFDGVNFNLFSDPHGILENNLCFYQLFDHSGNHWLSYWGGTASLTEINNNQFTSYINQNSSAGISSLTMDTAGIIWGGIGSWGGPFSFDGTTYTNYDVDSIIAYHGITAIAFNPNNNTGYFAGSAAGATDGFMKYQNGVFTEISIPYSIGHPTYSCMLSDNNNNIWIGTLGYTDNWGSVYPTCGLLKYNGSTFTQYLPSNSAIPDSMVQSLALDSLGRLWVGTISNGIGIYDGSSWTVIDTNNSPLPGNHIEWIYFKNGKTFIACQDKGFAIVDANNNWQVFNSYNSPLVNDDCESVVQDEECNVWIATECGLSEIIGDCNTNEKIIYGHISDDNGNALINTPVFLMKLNTAENILRPFDDTRTNQNGDYSFATQENNIYVFAEPEKLIYPLIMPGYQDTSLVQQDSYSISTTNSGIVKNIICKSVIPQSGNSALSGIINNELGAAVSGLRIYLIQNSFPVATTKTNMNGTFNFSAVNSGNYSIWVDKMGIINFNGPDLFLQNDSALFVNCVLHPSYLQILNDNIKNVERSDFKISPNPSNGILFINSTIQKNYSVEIFTMEGVLLKRINNLKNNTALNISEFNEGLYMIRINSDSKILNEKLVLVK